MKHFLRAILFTTTALHLFAVEPVLPSTGSPQRQAYDSLLNAKAFGFGPKLGQKERESDEAFQVLLSDPKAKEYFASLFEGENMHSKLYALCGLYYTDRKTFQNFTSRTDKNETIRTWFGCVIDEATTGKIITEIEKGSYDRYVNVPKK